MRRHGCDQKTIELALLEHNSNACDPPLEISEVQRIADSAMRYDPIRPNPDPISEGQDESNLQFCPKDLRELLNAPREKIEWPIPGYVAKGRWSIYAGAPKVGKTTLANEAIMAVAYGRLWLGRVIRQANVLILAVEEHADDVVQRLRLLGAARSPGRIKIAAGPLEFSANVLREIVEYVEEQQIGLVVIDTLPAWWHLENENDASEVLRSGRMLLNAIRKTKAGWLCLVHTRKSGGEAGDEIRGSSALLGLADIAISMKRYKGDAQMRVLESVSRFSETPRELVVRYTDKGYEAVGSPAQTSAHGKAEQVFAVLDRTPRTIGEIRKLTNLSKQVISRSLKFLGDRVSRDGKGCKGRPFRYWRRSNSIRPKSHSMAASLEESQEEERIHVD